MIKFTDLEIRNVFFEILNKINALDSGDKLPKGHFDLDQITKYWKESTDDGVFENMAVCIFLGGMKVKVVETKWKAMRDAFGNYKIDHVAGLDVDDLVKNPRIIRHRRKISGLIENARQIKIIQEKEGSFINYLKQRLEKGYDYLLTCIVKDFKYLAEATGADFLKDIGMGGFKPDIHVRRILERIGLFDRNVSALPALFKKISEICELPPHEIDRILFRYGSGHKMKYAICGTDPLCDVCQVSKCSHASRS